MTRFTPTTDPEKQPDLAVVIPAWIEWENIELLLPALKEMIASLRLTVEIVVTDGGSRDGTGEATQRRGARVVVQKEPGHGRAQTSV
jgi:glycosyltransferase involved in cell wall biosynthesis